jgi:hypothetical protein
LDFGGKNSRENAGLRLFIISVMCICGSVFSSTKEPS